MTDHYGYPPEAYGISPELAANLAVGVWNNQMIQFPRMQVVQVLEHNIFLRNWCQHKNKIIFQYVKFLPMPEGKYRSWQYQEAMLHQINTEMATRVSLKEVIYLEGKGMIFRKEDPEYIRLKLNYITELGT